MDAEKVKKERPNVPPVMLQFPEAAAYLTMGERSLKALVARGGIPRVQVSPRRVAFRIVDLDAYIASRRREG